MQREDQLTMETKLEQIAAKAELCGKLGDEVDQAAW
jgi:hypothetical protein